MTIDAQETEDGRALLSLSGEVDLSHVETVWNAAVEAFDRSPGGLVLDLAAITFLDSAILGVLIRIHRAAEERGVRFAVGRPSPLVLRLLRLTGLDHLIPIES